MQLADQASPAFNASSPKASPKAGRLIAVYMCQVAILVFAVIGAFHLVNVSMTNSFSASVAVVEERPSPAGPTPGFDYFPDQFVNQGTLPEEPIAQFYAEQIAARDRYVIRRREPLSELFRPRRMRKRSAVENRAFVFGTRDRETACHLRSVLPVTFLDATRIQCAAKAPPPRAEKREYSTKSHGNSASNESPRLRNLVSNKTGNKFGMSRACRKLPRRKPAVHYSHRRFIMFSTLIRPEHSAIRAVLVTSLLAVASANATDFVSHQMTFSDGSPYPGVSSGQGAETRRVGDVSAGHDAWLEQQLTASDGSSFVAAAVVPTRGQVRVSPIRYASREADAERATDTDVAAFATASLALEQNDLKSQLRISDGTTE